MTSFCGEDDYEEEYIGYPAFDSLPSDVLHNIKSFSGTKAAARLNNTNSTINSKSSLIESKFSNPLDLLWSAVDNNRVDVIEGILTHYTNVDVNSIRSWSPMRGYRFNISLVNKAIISMDDSQNTIKLLVDHGANIKTRDDRGNTSLHYAVEYMKLNMALKLLSSYRLSPNTIDNNGYTTMMKAILTSGDEDLKIRMVKALLSWGANVNETLDNKKNTPLYYACNPIQRKIIKVLLENGADVNLHYDGNNFEQIPVIRMMMTLDLEDDLDVIEMLLHHGADISIPNKRGDNTLHVAAGLQTLTVVKILVDHIIKQGKYSLLFIKNSDGLTPIDVSSRSKNIRAQGNKTFLNSIMHEYKNRPDIL